jgi:hypothetical protein
MVGADRRQDPRARRQRSALIFGGGYDPTGFGAAAGTPDTIGRAVYVVNGNGRRSQVVRIERVDSGSGNEFSIRRMSLH